MKTTIESKIYRFQCTRCEKIYYVDIKKATYPGYSTMCSDCAERTLHSRLTRYRQINNDSKGFRNGFPICAYCGGQVIGNRCLQCSRELKEGRNESKDKDYKRQYK